jgi:hypothetical protein
MCPKHWKMVSPKHQRDIWRHYRPGQEITKDPSLEYLGAMLVAIFAVADRENKSYDRDKWIAQVAVFFAARHDLNAIRQFLQLREGYET